MTAPVQTRHVPATGRQFRQPVALESGCTAGLGGPLLAGRAGGTDATQVLPAR
ncbi:hypothetical protein NDI56_07880 [Haloarcula sp. S1CR25-12]|uniref:Uncharacterized protein n=1 Tax=Haloarcula saliterrae TaxID=2950534 RepID=A0ABU2FAN5_9EURY|nr:hypothetical protein [Haloarcula sp. S1CR25-12]MDS0259309.1 hypothetical protein [Haloarcula sp. S1CR25-12]